MTVAPLTIEIMIELYCGGDGENIKPELWNSEAAQKTRALLRSAGLIDDELNATSLGRNYVERLLAVELLPNTRAANE